MVISLSASAGVGISTLRVYLDNEQSEQNFIVYSKDPKRQDCTLFIKHYEVAEDGNLISLAEDFTPQNSAKQLIRFSPKTFSLGGAKSQSVRFRMRRKPNVEAAEFRAFLAVDCIFDQSELAKERGDVQYGLVPRLRHNIPIIVRTAKLEASVEFADIKVSDDAIGFSVKRQGTRSLYGRVELIDMRSNKIISKNTHFVLYPETPQKIVSFSTKGVSSEHLSIRFVENPKEGGSINHIKSVL